MRRHTRTHTCIRPQRARAAIRSLLATRRAVPDARARTRARARGPAAAAAQTQARRACGPVRPPAFESGRLLLCGKSLDALTARTRQRNQRASASAINLACRRPLWPPPASQYPSVAPSLCLDPAALHPPPLSHLRVCVYNKHTILPPMRDAAAWLCHPALRRGHKLPCSLPTTRSLTDKPITGVRLPTNLQGPARARARSFDLPAAPAPAPSAVAPPLPAIAPCHDIRARASNGRRSASPCWRCLPREPKNQLVINRHRLAPICWQDCLLHAAS